jgi:hypothetical protein
MDLCIIFKLQNFIYPILIDLKGSRQTKSILKRNDTNSFFMLGKVSKLS